MSFGNEFVAQSDMDRCIDEASGVLRMSEQSLAAVGASNANHRQPPEGLGWNKWTLPQSFSATRSLRFPMCLSLGNRTLYPQQQQQQQQQHASFNAWNHQASSMETVDGILDYAQQVLDQDQFDLDPTPIAPGRVHVVDQLPLLTFSDFCNNSQASTLSDIILPPASKKIKYQDTASLTPPVDNGSTLIPAACMSQHSAATMSEQEETSPTEASRFRSYQAETWTERLQELCDFRARFGHCLVPHNWTGNVPLAQWVKRQRYQFKLKEEGRHSTLSDERKSILEGMGFVWDSHRAAWEERWVELHQFKEKHGHCNVPSKYEVQPQLSVWVKCQRRQHKLFKNGERSTMTDERVRKMDTLGFVWNPRKL
jgi:Helicase associated domain